MKHKIKVLKSLIEAAVISGDNAGIKLSASFGSILDVISLHPSARKSGKNFISKKASIHNITA
ncbi:unnamed protein product [Dovyalis caffra]|uniref:Uncharacterized protein n=1 Tax=Dovyalis caffra TaxID=77055 RepID=A0AAV1R0X4_9ROSI|nr:unnamed protein product [Dovyalis caffra]